MLDQVKIGKFISELRKSKNMTQEQLAANLGVTDRAISKWENGRGMPDLSLIKPLCQNLDISINELLSGERLTPEDYQERSEENIVNTIDYSKRKIHNSHQIISLLLIIFGLFISISAIMIFPSESSWGSIYATFGVIIFVIGIFLLMKNIKFFARLLLILVTFIGSMGILIFTDFLNVKLNNEVPMFRTSTTYIYDVIYYDTPFYDVLICHTNTDNEYLTIEKNHNYSNEELYNYCK